MPQSKVGPMSSKSLRLWLTIGTIAGIVVPFVLLTPPVWNLRNGPIAVVRWPKTGETTVLIGPQQPTWVALKGVSHHVLHAIVVAEDARFYDHFGLDLREIRSSIEFNMERKRYARGASTITQQVVKMAFLNADKNMLRKAREAVGALVLEQLLSKDRILEWYINLVEFGDGVFGIKAAAAHFFDTTPELLTIQDGAHLALVLPSPNRWSKGLRQRELTEFGHRRYTQIIDEMFKQGFITPTLRDTALATGDFGRPIEGYRPHVEPSEEMVDAYYDLPGQEPPPFGHNRHRSAPAADRKTPRRIP